MNFILGAFIGSWTQCSNWQITHEALARFMDLPVWPLRSWSNKCTQNEIQSLSTPNNHKVVILKMTNGKSDLDLEMAAISVSWALRRTKKNLNGWKPHYITGISQIITISALLQTKHSQYNKPIRQFTLCLSRHIIDLESHNTRPHNHLNKHNTHLCSVIPFIKRWFLTKTRECEFYKVSKQIMRLMRPLNEHVDQKCWKIDILSH